MAMNENMKGNQAIPENEKVRKYRMNSLDEQINKTKAHIATLKQGKQSALEQVSRLKEDIKQRDITIEKLTSANNEYLKQHEKLRVMNLEIQDVDTLRKEKEKLEGQVNKLKTELMKATEALNIEEV